MTGEPLIDWAALAVSLFNTLVLIWLGFAVLLNAERRRWGIWLAGGGLLMGGFFFIAHSAILGRGLYATTDGMDFWWHAGWIPVTLLPLAWYCVMLWYAGFWDDARSPLHRRQRPWLVLALVLAVVLAGLLALGNPLPSYARVVQLDLSASPSLFGIPLLILLYPAYSLLCLSLPLDALRRPGPSARMMGELARRRARPWLAAASATLLLACAFVAGALAWIILSAGQRETFGPSPSMLFALVWLDLTIDVFIAVAIVLIGQAVVSYEVFTGRTLPRRGLLRHWRNALVLALCYALMTSFSIVMQFRPVYVLIVTGAVVALFYALFSWYSYAERERSIASLRPFVTSQRLYEYLLTDGPASAPDVDMALPFRALCRDVVGARLAYLIPLGALAPLAGPGLAYPSGEAPVLPALGDLGAHLRSPQGMGAPVDPEQFAGAHWAVPLWSERGLIGVLLLGEKSDGGPYTQEEIEIARASGERLVDTQAGAEMARRLMALQRRRLAESQVLDRRARRVLHDDVLPRLHAAMLGLSASAAPEALAPLAEVHRQVSDLLREMPATAAPEVARHGLFGALREVIDEEMEGAFDAIDWQVPPEAERAAASISPLSSEVLFYAAREALRNAARHGRGGDSARALHLYVTAACNAGLELAIQDDGVGLASASPPGEGTGQGLALHSTLLAVVGGSLATESLPGKYTRVLLALPRPA